MKFLMSNYTNSLIGLTMPSFHCGKPPTQSLQPSFLLTGRALARRSVRSCNHTSRRHSGNLGVRSTKSPLPPLSAHSLNAGYLHFIGNLSSQKCSHVVHPVLTLSSVILPSWEDQGSQHFWGIGTLIGSQLTTPSREERAIWLPTFFARHLYYSV